MRDTPELGSAGHLRRAVAEGCLVAMESRARPPLASRLGLAGDGAALPSSIAPLSAASRAQLRASVTAFVRRLRMQGTPPERVIVLVKDTARQALPAPMHGAEARAVIEDIVRWSIGAYYDGG